MAKKTLPFEAAHTYEAHMRGCVPGVYYKEAICITNLSLAGVRSPLRLPHIPVTAFSQTDLFLV